MKKAPLFLLLGALLSTSPLFATTSDPVSVPAFTMELVQNWVNSLDSTQIKQSAQDLWTSCVEKYQSLKEADATDYSEYYEKVLTFLNEITPQIDGEEAKAELNRLRLTISDLLNRYRSNNLLESIDTDALKQECKKDSERLKEDAKDGLKSIKKSWKSLFN